MLQEHLSTASAVGVTDMGTVLLVVPVSVVVTVLTQWLKSMFDKGRATEAAQQEARRTADLENTVASLRSDLRGLQSGSDKTLQQLSNDVASIRGMLIGVDGQNGMRADVKEMRTEIRSAREKIGSVDTMGQILTERVSRLEEVRG